jgi:hypothetical protein
VSDQPPASAELSAAARPRKDDLFWLGVALTVVWLAVGILFMLYGSDRTNAPKPNEWGDIFAGLFAPVAFLWLVLGFKQQGRELQLSTRALELQVTELRQSVEQQKELVEVTRQQVLATLDEHARRRAIEHAATQPRFLITSRSVRGGPEGSIYELSLVNEGAAASNIAMAITPEPLGNPLPRLPFLAAGTDWNFNIRYEPQMPPEVKVQITYEDMNNVTHSDLHIARVETLPNGSRLVLVTRSPPDTPAAQAPQRTGQ